MRIFAGLAHPLGADQVAGVVIGDFDLLPPVVLGQGELAEPCRHILHDILGLPLEDLRLGGVHPFALQEVDILLLESGPAGGAVHQHCIHLGPGEGGDVLLHIVQRDIPLPRQDRGDPAAILGRGNLDLHMEFLEDIDDRLPYVPGEVIGKAAR